MSNIKNAIINVATATVRDTKGGFPLDGTAGSIREIFLMIFYVKFGVIGCFLRFSYHRKLWEEEVLATLFLIAED